jgi:hypothetical protein
MGHAFVYIHTAGLVIPSQRGRSHRQCTHRDRMGNGFFFSLMAQVVPSGKIEGAAK